MARSAEELVSLVEALVESGATRDEVLRGTVDILKRDRVQYDWAGIYLLEGDSLVLHSFIGKPTEHTRIPIGVGVCGTALANQANQVIEDVTKLDNYLACSVETRSEIVVLIRRAGQIFGQIDIDSDQVGAFNGEDESMLNRVADCLARRF